VRGKDDEPVAVQTRLGWVLSGPMKVSGRLVVVMKQIVFKLYKT
jgi:hypothetical protein